MKPNILILMSDQHRPDALGAAGHPVVQTPHLDRLAAEGVRFARAYCQGPLCMPARASFLTERYVREHGVSDNRRELAQDTPTFLQRMREAEYYTSCIGKMHLYTYHPALRDMRDEAPRLDRLGFDEPHETGGKGASAQAGNEFAHFLAERGQLDAYRAWYRSLRGQPAWAAAPFSPPLETYLDVWVGQRTVRWIEEYDRAQPWLMWAGFGGPHSPWDTPAPYAARYDGVEIPLGSTRRPELDPDSAYGALMAARLRVSDTDTLSDEAIREMRRAYYGNITLIDEQVGAIVEALRRKGVLENTWIIYTADHGEMAGDHGLLAKRVFYEPAAGVPLIVRPPHGAETRAAADRVAGTVVDALVQHLDLPATARAIAGAPHLEGSAGRSLLGYLGTGEAQRREVAISETLGFAMFATDRYKLIVDETQGKPVQLFDLTSDPAEDHNLVQDDATAAVRERLMAEQVRPFLARPQLHRPEIPGAKAED